MAYTPEYTGTELGDVIIDLVAAIFVAVKDLATPIVIMGIAGFFFATIGGIVGMAWLSGHRR